MSIRLRIQDWLNEREIRKLGDHCVEAMASGRREEAIHFWQAQCKAINERSPAQVERMERRMGLHPRRTLKRSLMTAYFARFVPAFLVTIVFKLFKLRGL